MRLSLLAGGVGGGRMADGFQQCLGGGLKSLSVVVNVGDDFQLHGLNICPDLDTVMYTMAGLGHVEQGWGLAGETYQAHSMLSRLGEPDWFRLGDQDLAIHILRTDLLRQGRSLTDITLRLARTLGVKADILPMCDQPVSTRVATASGWLSFQDYFVKRQHKDQVKGFEFRGIDQAHASPQVVEALSETDVIVVAPSNPFVSIAPILALEDVRRLLSGFSGPRVAVSPIVGGRALKGPAAQMFLDLGLLPSCLGLAQQYQGLLDGIIIDEQDRSESESLAARGLKVLCSDTVMRDRPSRGRLAAAILDWVQRDF